VKALFLILFTHSLMASTLYVQSPIARLLSEPNLASTAKPLKSGLEVQKVGEQDMFFKIKTGTETGWILKIYTSKNPPSTKANTAAANDEKSGAVQSRARASTFTETASARGLSESKKLRTRGNSDEYDFEGLEWLDKILISEEDKSKFKEE
jgi:hypothetical protein